MDPKWLSSDFNQDQLILAGDVGGTNTNIAIVGKTGDKFTIIVECVYKSSEVKDLVGPIQETLKVAADKNAALKPTLCCISAAGPVSNNFCPLTNCDWDVDGAAIEKATGLKTLIINDFLAIGYGIPTLDVTNPQQITQLACTDGTKPKASGTTKAVVGAGTGLVSKNADSNPTCRQIMDIFIKMYGKFAGSMAVIFLAGGGLYLAGGIVTKNEKYLVENNLFMKYFEMNYNPNIQPLLKKTPVYIIKDYSISLYGAANAGITLIK